MNLSKSLDISPSTVTDIPMSFHLRVYLCMFSYPLRTHKRQKAAAINSIKAL